MAHRQLAFEHDIELSPTIVWDALVDPVLVSGWLGEAAIEPVHGGEYSLSWLGSQESPPVAGRIEVIDPPRELAVTSSGHGRFAFHLAENEGGARGTWTRMVVEVDVEVDAAFEQRVRATWLAALEQLDQLLRGHPVDWSTRISRPDASVTSHDRRRT